RPGVAGGGLRTAADRRGSRTGRPVVAAAEGHRVTGPAAGTVLVVGAGPTGLTMAAQIHALGGDVRIVERRRDRELSRAFIVHPRTLEVLAPLGVVDALIARGDRSTVATLR